MSDAPPRGWVRAKIADATEFVPHANPENSPEKDFGYVDISAIDNSTFSINHVHAAQGNSSRLCAFVPSSDTPISRAVRRQQRRVIAASEPVAAQKLEPHENE